MSIAVAKRLVGVHGIRDGDETKNGAPWQEDGRDVVLNPAWKMPLPRILAGNGSGTGVDTLLKIVRQTPRRFAGV